MTVDPQDAQRPSSGRLAGRRFHFIGIGGAGMSVVAELLAGQGGQVSGSDRQESAVLKVLRQKGIDAYSPHDAEAVPANATVVVSSAIRPTNPELRRARLRAQTVLHRSEALALAAQGQPFIAVAGAHGKTSTSAMIAMSLLHNDVDVSYAIGGPVLGDGTGARVGSQIFVAEADESDGSFLHYYPSIEVVTNVEADHLDHFGSERELTAVFERFVDNLQPGGTLICCAEDPGSLALADHGRLRGDLRRVITYGRPERCPQAPDVSIEQVALSQTRADALLVTETRSYPVHLAVTGVHNVLNAAGAWAACVASGVGGEQAAHGLSNFQGAGRRFEERGRVGGRRVFDDYAHHPTEVQAALAQARIVAGEGRVVAVFQPHLFSRTRTFATRFATALSGADVVVLTDIYAAREDPIEGVNSSLIAQSPSLKAPAILVPDVHEAAVAAADMTQDGDICLLIGAGDIFLEAPTVVARWESGETA